MSRITSATITSGYWYCCLWLVVFAFLATLAIDSTSPYAYTTASGAVSDSYYIASFAKNVAYGFGWSTWNGTTWLPMDLHISTGPIVFLPTSLALVLGISATQAIPTAALVLHAILLGISIYQWQKQHPPYQCFLFVFLILTFFLYFQRYQWYLCLGEVTCTLLIALATYIIATQPVNHRTLFFAASTVSAATLSKLLGIFAIAALSIYALLRIHIEQKTQPKRFIGHAATWFTGIISLPTLACLLLLQNFSLSEITIQFFAYLNLYLTQHGGIPLNPATWLDSHVYMMAYWNFLHIKDLWNTSISPLLILLISIQPLGLLFIYRRHTDKNQAFIFLCSAVSLLYIVWFYFLGLHQQPRYFYIGGTLSFLAFAAALVEQSKSWRPLNRNILITTPLIFLFLYIPITTTRGDHPYIYSLKSMAQTINSNNKINTITWITNSNPPWPFLSFYLNKEKQWQSLFTTLRTNTTFDTENYLSQLNETERASLLKNPISVEEHFLTHIKESNHHGRYLWKTNELQVATLLTKQNQPGDHKPIARCHNTIAENTDFLLAWCTPMELDQAINTLNGLNHRLSIIVDPANPAH